ncbi:MAG TPA: metal ABC transporter ATP-binding protein [Vicinamibacteria bacterium]|nr:metal ABC transporter ATP-binding protein [Vicinamibacteria bacterium]
MSPGPALVARDLSVTLGARRVLDGVSLDVSRGELLCLVGPNGGGKTTFLKVALWLLAPEAGSVEVLGGPPRAARRRVGYLPQRKAFAHGFPASAAELVLANRYGAWPSRVGPREREEARRVLGRVGGERLLDQPLAALSGGETQRVFLARALAIQPELLLLDEPTAGVDARGRSEFLALLAEVAGGGDLTVVLVTHNLAAVRQLADRVAHLDGRLLAWGRPEETLRGLEHQGAFEARDHERPAVCETD